MAPINVNHPASSLKKAGGVLVIVPQAGNTLKSSRRAQPILFWFGRPRNSYSF
jgi:hypothetical protein